MCGTGSKMWEMTPKWGEVMPWGWPSDLVWKHSQGFLAENWSFVRESEHLGWGTAQTPEEEQPGLWEWLEPERTEEKTFFDLHFHFQSICILSYRARVARDPQVRAAGCFKGFAFCFNSQIFLIDFSVSHLELDAPSGWKTPKSSYFHSSYFHQFF